MTSLYSAAILMLLACGCALHPGSRLGGEWGLRQGEQSIEARQNEQGTLIERSIIAPTDGIMVVIFPDGGFDLRRMTMLGVMPEYKRLRNRGDRLEYEGGFLEVARADYASRHSLLILEHCTSQEDRHCAYLWFRADLREDGRLTYHAGRATSQNMQDSEAFDKAVLRRFTP